MNNYKNYINESVIALVLLLLSFLSVKGQECKAILHLDIFFKEAKANDTLYLKVDNIVMTLTDIPRFQFQAVSNNNGHFCFDVQVPISYGYFRIYKNRQYPIESLGNIPISMTRALFYEAGDSLNVTISYKENEFGLESDAPFYATGRGSAKYKLLNELYDDYDYKKNFNQKVKADKLSILDSYKNKISPLSYQIMKADLLYSFDFSSANQQLQKMSVKKYRATHHEDKKNLLFISNPHGISDQGLANSIVFQKYIYSIKAGLLTSSSYQKFGEYSLQWIFNSITNSRIGWQTKEVLLLRLFYSPRPTIINQQALYQQAKHYIRSRPYTDLLEDIQHQNQRKIFPDFRLEDVTGKWISLADFKNKIVIIDFWFTGCGACSDYYENTLSKAEKLLATDSSIVFLSISVDLNKETWKRGMGSGKYTSKDAYNLYTMGQGNRHQIIQENGIMGFPFVVLLDKKSIVKYYNSAQLYELGSLLKCIKNIKGTSD